MLLARSQGVAWRFADLREFPAPVTRSIMVGIASSFRQTGARGLILDDFPADADNALISAIGQVARAIADADGVLIITSMKPPQPTLSGRLGLDADAIIRVPYLNEEDVADMVTAAGGDPHKWARSIHVFAGGHPQLVDARVAGLEQRGWNEKEILASIVPFKGSTNDMEEERKAVRSRLLQELPPNATEVLLRLSLLHGNFDRAMALVVADAPDAVPRAGLEFDFLVGPWIEQVGPDRYRLSPLLKDSATAGLSPALQQSIKSNVMKYLIKQRPFPADQLLQVFLIAFEQDDREGLTWFGHAVLAASSNPKKTQFKRLAQEVSVFALVDWGEGKPLIPDDAPAVHLASFCAAAGRSGDRQYEAGKEACGSRLGRKQLSRRRAPAISRCHDLHDGNARDRYPDQAKEMAAHAFKPSCDTRDAADLCKPPSHRRPVWRPAADRHAR